MAQEGTRCELLVSSINRKRVLRSNTAQQSVLARGAHARIAQAQSTVAAGERVSAAGDRVHGRDD